MGKNKLRKFAEVEAMPHVMQFPFGRLATEGFPLKGRWREDFFTTKIQSYWNWDAAAVNTP